MPGNPVNWFEIYVQDMDRARAFYTGVLQTRLEKLAGPDLEMWAFPSDQSAHGTSGALVRTGMKASGGNSTVVYFRCDDCAEEAGRVVANGGRLERDKMSIGDYGFVAMATDPDGNLIGFHSMK